MTPAEDIKSRLPIEQLVGEYVTLKRSGVNFKGLCPFHQEKTPSFMVNPERQIWHCFGCNEGGDIFTFLQKFENVDFREAIVQLARKTGVELHGMPIQNEGAKKKLYEINERACEYFKTHLNATDVAAEKTRSYVTGRSIDTESITQWDLGLASGGWDDLSNYLTAQGFQLADQVTAGLTIARDGKHYDRFRRRLMFPIHDAQGKVVAFTARTLAKIVYDEDDIGGKYVNSPQTPLYNKSSILYGFHHAKQEIKRLGYVIVVEGNLDVIMTHQAGTKNTVGVSGTAFTNEQLKLLKRYTSNLILAFDSDTAGSQAVFKGITLAWEQDMNVKVIVMTEGKDPADMVAKDPEVWRDAVRNAIGVVDYYFEAVFARVDLSRVDHKKMAAQKIAGIISKLKTELEQEHYIQILAQKLSLSEKSLWSMVQKQPVQPVVPVAPATQQRTLESQALMSQHLLMMIAAHDAFLPQALDELEPEMISTEFQNLYKAMAVQYTSHRDTNLSTLGSLLSQDDVRRWSDIAFRGSDEYGQLPVRIQETLLAQLIKRVKAEHYSRRLSELTDAIARAEQEGDIATLTQLLVEHQSVSTKRAQALA